MNGATVPEQAGELLDQAIDSAYLGLKQIDAQMRALPGSDPQRAALGTERKTLSDKLNALIAQQTLELDQATPVAALTSRLQAETAQVAAAQQEMAQATVDVQKITGLVRLLDQVLQTVTQIAAG